jgi:hypothetical protein
MIRTPRHAHAINVGRVDSVYARATDDRTAHRDPHVSDGHKQKMLDALIEEPFGLGLPEFAEICGVSGLRCETLLAEMAEQGLVEKIGKGRTARWVAVI